MDEGELLPDVDEGTKVRVTQEVQSCVQVYIF